jgi:hypothetical protein
MRICTSILCLAVILWMPAIRPAASEEKGPWPVPTFECLGLCYPCAPEQGACEGITSLRCARRFTVVLCAGDSDWESRCLAPEQWNTERPAWPEPRARGTVL